MLMGVFLSLTNNHRRKHKIYLQLIHRKIVNNQGCFEVITLIIPSSLYVQHIVHRLSQPSRQSLPQRAGRVGGRGALMASYHQRRHLGSSTLLLRGNIISHSSEYSTELYHRAVQCTTTYRYVCQYADAQKLLLRKSYLVVQGVPSQK